MNGVLDLLFAFVRTSTTVLIVEFVVLTLILLLNALRVRKRLSFFLLWVVVLRMCIPAALPASSFSLFNVPFVQEISQRYDLPEHGGYVGDYDVAVEGTEKYDDGLYAGLEPEKDDSLHFRYLYYSTDEAGQLQPAETFREKYGTLTAAIWLAGVAIFWGYGILSAILLKRRVATATIVEPGVYETDRIDSPFILGYFKPVIYLPLGLDEEQKRMILCHERMHLRWGDHIFKLVAYLAVGLHWYNIWLGVYFYRALLELMEEACDQDVLRELGAEYKADYSEALLTFSTKKQFGRVMTVAFSESWIKERIKTVLRYKKPIRWLTVPALALMLATALSLTTAGVDNGGTQVETIFLTHEEMEQSDLPGSTIRFSLEPGKDIEAFALELEVWSPAGLLEKKRLMELPMAQNTLVEWAFSLYSDRALQRTTFMDCSLRINGNLEQYTVDLGDYYPAMATLVGSQPRSFDADDLILFCGLHKADGESERWLDISAFSGDIPIPLESGEMAVVLRLRQYQTGQPWPMTIHDLLPKGFLPEDTMEIAAEGKQALLTGEQAKTLRYVLSDLAFTYRMELGKTTVAREGLPFLRLYAGDGRILELTVSSNAVTLYDPASGHAVQARGDSLAFRSLMGKVYRQLGIEKTCREVFSMPETVGESAFGYTLNAAIPSKDIWLYSNDKNGDLMLLLQGNSSPVNYRFGAPAQSLEWRDFDGNGAEELLVLCGEDQVDRLFFLSPEGDGEWIVTGLDENSLYFFLPPEYGTHADHPQLFGLHFFELGRDFWFEKTDDHVVDEKEPYVYRNGRFFYENGSILASVDCMLHLKAEAQSVLIPCVRLTCQVHFLGERAETAPFSFSNLLIEPLDNR